MKQKEKLHNLPIYKKAELIFQMVNSLMSTISEDDEYLNETKYLICDHAAIICAKIAGAEGGSIYSIRMQNAALIREHAMQLNSQIGSLRFHESFKELEYVILIREEINAFRLLFIDWVANFDKSNYSWDDWELFNPSGAIAPEDTNLFDEPFISDEFFEGLDLNEIDFDEDDED